VKCVSGNKLGTGPFIDNGDGTVTDTASSLVWQQGEVVGQMLWWEEALKYCETLTLANKTDWRLPNIKELESLVDDTRESLQIDTRFFPGARAVPYWSSTTFVTDPTWAWTTPFNTGAGQARFEKNGPSSYYNFGVRCVRGTGDTSQKKVVFVPSFLGSRLYRQNDDGSAGDRLWETACNGDIEYLMPNSDGSFNSDRPVTLKAKSYSTGKSDHGIVDWLQAECAPEGDYLKYQYLIDFLDSTVGTQNWQAVPWDWRLSLDKAAENLRSTIDQMAAQGTGKVVLITHSTGGLLARAYLKKYGSAKVERFISVAAPHFGTPIAFRELLHGDRDVVWWRLNDLIPKSDWRQIGSRMHSAHQLLPTQQSFEIAQAYKDLGPVYNKKRLWSLRRFQDNCSQGWKFNIPDQGHSTQGQFFRWLEDHPDMVQEGNVDYPLELGHPFLDRAAIMQGSGGALDWVPDIPINLVYGLGVSTHIRTSYARQRIHDRRNHIVTCGDITREYDKNLYGDGTVPSWSARSIPNQNEQVSLHSFSLSGVGGKNYDHSTIFGHPEIQNLLKSLLVNGSTATAMSVSSEEPRRLSAAATTTPAMSVFVAYGQHVQLHAYDSQNWHTGPLPDGTEETAIPVSSYYSDGFTHKVWLPGDTRAYRVEARALQNDADVIVRAESWNEVEQIDEAEFAPQWLAGNGTVTITGSDSTTGAASDLVIHVDADGDGNPDQTVPPLVLHLLTVTPPTNGLVQSKPEGINCGTDCSAPFVEGVEVILTATPQPGYTFTGWGGACNGTGTCTVTINQPLGVSATFAKANRLPVANAGPDQTVECTGPTGARVTLDGSGSSDPDSDPLTFTWTGPFGKQSGEIIQPTIPLGAHNISLEVTDGKGGAANDTVNVTVRDTTPPTLSVTLTPNRLWPPNHKMVTVTADVQASDTCDPNPTVALVSITSNEPDNGLGDGDTPNDIQNAAFGTDDRSFALRAERSGTGTGRIYTVTYRATNSAGKTSTASAQVVVPHSQSNK
jgi:uncharacterized repeat protein (TIGR02543 family)